MENTEKIILGIALTLAIMGYVGPAMAAIYIEEKERKERGELPQRKALYDERQKMARLQAALFSLISLCGYLTLWMVLHLGGWFEWTTAVVELIFCGFMFAATVGAGYCVLNDASIGWNQKPETVKTQKILYVVYGFMFPVYAGAQEGSMSVVFLFVSLCMWAMAVATFYADHRRKKAEKLAETEEPCEEVDAP